MKWVRTFYGILLEHFRNRKSEDAGLHAALALALCLTVNALTLVFLGAGIINLVGVFGTVDVRYTIIGPSLYLVFIVSAYYRQDAFTAGTTYDITSTSGKIGVVIAYLVGSLAFLYLTLLVFGSG